jgi:hypothetical protein
MKAILMNAFLAQIALGQTESPNTTNTTDPVPLQAGMNYQCIVNGAVGTCPFNLAVGQKLSLDLRLIYNSTRLKRNVTTATLTIRAPELDFPIFQTANHTFTEPLADIQQVAIPILISKFNTTGIKNQTQVFVRITVNELAGETRYVRTAITNKFSLSVNQSDVTNILRIPPTVTSPPNLGSAVIASNNFLLYILMLMLFV